MRSVLVLLVVLPLASATVSVSRASTLNGYNNVATGVADEAGFSYFGLKGSEAMIIKVDEQLVVVDELTLPGFTNVESSVIDQDSGYAYFGVAGSSAGLFRIDTSDSQFVAEQASLGTSSIGTSTSFGAIVVDRPNNKILTGTEANAVHEWTLDTFTLASGAVVGSASAYICAFNDPATSSAWFVTESEAAQPSRFQRINTKGVMTPVDTLVSLDADVVSCARRGKYGYFGTRGDTVSIISVNLDDTEQKQTLELSPEEGVASSLKVFEIEGVILASVSGGAVYEISVADDGTMKVVGQPVSIGQVDDPVWALGSSSKSTVTASSNTPSIASLVTFTTIPWFEIIVGALAVVGLGLIVGATVYYFRHPEKFAGANTGIDYTDGAGDVRSDSTAAAGAPAVKARVVMAEPAAAAAAADQGSAGRRARGSKGRRSGGRRSSAGRRMTADPPADPDADPPADGGDAAPAGSKGRRGTVERGKGRRSTQQQDGSKGRRSTQQQDGSKGRRSTQQQDGSKGRRSTQQDGSVRGGRRGGRGGKGSRSKAGGGGGSTVGTAMSPQAAVIKKEKLMKQVGELRGWVELRKGETSSWKRVFWNVEAAEIISYTDEGMSAPVGVIELDAVKDLEQLEGEYEGREFVFRLATPGANVYVAAETEDEAEDWITALSKLTKGSGASRYSVVGL